MKIILHTELELQDDATVEDVQRLRDALHDHVMALMMRREFLFIRKREPTKVFAKHSKPVARQRRAG